MRLRELFLDESLDSLLFIRCQQQLYCLEVRDLHSPREVIMMASVYAESRQWIMPPFVQTSNIASFDKWPPTQHIEFG